MVWIVYFPHNSIKKTCPPEKEFPVFITAQSREIQADTRHISFVEIVHIIKGKVDAGQTDAAPHHKQLIYVVYKCGPTYRPYSLVY